MIASEPARDGPDDRQFRQDRQPLSFAPTMRRRPSARTPQRPHAGRRTRALLASQHGALRSRLARHGMRGERASAVVPRRLPGIGTLTLSRSALCRFFRLMTAEGCAGPKAGLCAMQNARALRVRTGRPDKATGR
jgi:hypothetical protein